MTTSSVIPPRLLFVFFLAAALASSAFFPSIPPSSGLTQRDFTYLNDQHLTVSNGNTKVCGDHMCAPGEWTKLQESLAAAQKGNHTSGNTTQGGVTHTSLPSTAGFSYIVIGPQETAYQVNPTVPVIPYPPPSPIPTPSPSPQSEQRDANQTSPYVGSDKPYYQLGMQQGTVVHIHGILPGLPNGTVTVMVRSPAGMYKTITVHTDRDGSFWVPYIVDVNAPIGMYLITAEYNGSEVSGSFYVMRS